MPSELETLRQQVEAEKQRQELASLRAEVADEKRRQQEGGELAGLKAALAKERARSALPAAADEPPKKKKTRGEQRSRGAQGSASEGARSRVAGRCQGAA